MNIGVVLIIGIVVFHAVFAVVVLAARHFAGVTFHPITLPAMATRTPPPTLPGATPVGDIAVAAVPAEHAHHFLSIDRTPSGGVCVSVPAFCEVDIARDGEWHLYGVFYSPTNINLECNAAQLFFRSRPLRP